MPNKRASRLDQIATELKSGKQLKQFGWIHEIACPSENVVFVAEILNWRIQKLILKPAPPKAQ